MIELNVTNLVGGNIVITTTPPVSPSPYFTYDSNRVITGLYRGSPNTYAEGTYTDWFDDLYAESHDGNYPEKPYSGWTYGGSDVVDSYALGIADNAFSDIGYYQDGIPPSRAVSGQLSFPNITSIGDYAFFCCDGLTSISFPKVTSIGEYAFFECNGLMSLTIGSNIETIGQSAFGWGSSMTLTIGKPISWVETRYSDWGLPYGSTIVCTDGTITTIETE